MTTYAGYLGPPPFACPPQAYLDWESPDLGGPYVGVEMSEPWTYAELTKLNDLRGRGLEWGEIAAALPGRTPDACKAATIRHDLPCRTPADRTGEQELLDRIAAAFREDPARTDAAVGAIVGLHPLRVQYYRKYRLKIPGLLGRMMQRAQQP